MPLLHLAAGFKQHPAPDGDDAAGLFGDGDEFIGRDQSALRMLPADQRLEACQPPGFERHDGLILNEELAAINGAAQVGFQLQHVDGVRVHAFVEDDVARFAEELRLIHGGVGVAQKIFGALVADV